MTAPESGYLQPFEDTSAPAGPPRRNTSEIPAMPAHSAALKVVVSVIGGLILLVAGGIVQHSCAGCMALGTWSPPYQPIQDAKAESASNATEHAAIRKEMRDSLSAIQTQITTGNQEIIKAITESKEPAKPGRRPR